MFRISRSGFPALSVRSGPCRIAACLTLCSLLAGKDLMAQTADVIFVNGHVYTVDDRRSSAAALAISGSNILAVGSNDTIKRLAGEGTRVVDLAGRMLMPGIHDAHTHLLLAGLKWTHECRLPPNTGPQAIVATLQACAAKLPADAWLVAGDYNPNAFGDHPVNKDFLDTAFPDRPVYLYEFSIHHALVNSAALARASIDDKTPNPPKGEIRRGAAGEATGELVENATALVTRVIPPYADSVYREALRFAVARCHEFGITSIQEASATRRLLGLYRDFDRAGELNLSVLTHIVWGSEKWGEESPAALDELIASRKAFASPHVDVNAVKIWMDGAPLPPYFSEADISPDTGQPDANKLLFSSDQLATQLARWADAGIKPKIHVAGSGAVRAALDAIERGYGSARYRNGVRPELAHNSTIDPADLPRFARLGTVAEMSPAIWHLGEVKGFEMFNDWWPFRSLLDSGATMVIGSDWILPPDPNLFPALEGAITRPSESLSLREAIDMMTRNGAANVGQASAYGILEAGKRANLIILDRDLFTTAPRDIGETQVLMTVFEGRTVYLSAHAPSAWREGVSSITTMGGQ